MDLLPDKLTKDLDPASDPSVLTYVGAIADGTLKKVTPAQMGELADPGRRRLTSTGTNLTITSANVADHQFGLVVFTNTSGVLTLTIEDDVFTIGDRLTVKHYASGADTDAGVDLTLQGAGADIEGSTTSFVPVGGARTFIYVGSNVWLVSNDITSPSQFISSVSYSDLATATTPVVIPDTLAWTDLPNDTLGSQTNLEFLASNIGELWDEVTGEFDLSSLSNGDHVTFRIDVDATTNSPNQDVFLRMLFGVGAGEFDFLLIDRQVKSVSTEQFQAELSFVVQDDNARLNPAKVQMASDGVTDVKVNGWLLLITKRSGMY